MRVRSPWMALLVLASLGAGTGCDGGDRAADAAADREAARAGWTLALDAPGADAPVVLERLDIYVSEDEEASEIYELLGEGVALVGEIPPGLAVGYEEALDRLVGQSVAIASSGGDPREPKSSHVTVGGAVLPVSGGTITFEKLTGRWSGLEGDRTLHGTVELRVPGADGDRVLRGRFAVHAVSWG